MTEQLPEILGGITGSFLYALFVYSVLKWLIYNKIKSLLSLLVTFAIAILITFLFFSLDPFVNPLHMHIPFIILLTLIDLIKFIKVKKEASE